MASVKVKFRASSKPNREGRLFYQVIHDRRTRQIATDYRIYPTEWDEARSAIAYMCSMERLGHLTAVRDSIKTDLKRFEGIFRKFAKGKVPYSAEDIVAAYIDSASKVSFFNEMEKTIRRLSQHGKFRTAQAYASTLRSFRRYRQDKDIYLDGLNVVVMEGYQAWLQQQGLVPNTVSFYCRIIRAVYNRAVEEELTDNRRPFRHVYTGVDRTVKRGLPLQLLKKIKLLDLTLLPDLEYARDMFLLSFMLRGMSFIDMAFLKKTDLCNGYVTYRRRKTHQQLTIAWTSDMQRIIDKYPDNTSDYLLPIIRNPGRVERFVFKNVGELINKRLKTVAEMAGVGIPLTMYVARHSWASIARSKGIPLSVISEGLGHEKESTTRIYLSTLDTSAVDQANGMILKLL